MDALIYLRSTAEIAQTVLNEFIEQKERVKAQRILLERIHEVPIDWSMFDTEEQTAIKRAVHISLD